MLYPQRDRIRFRLSKYHYSVMVSIQSILTDLTLQDVVKLSLDIGLGELIRLYAPTIAAIKANGPDYQHSNENAPEAVVLPANAMFAIHPQPNKKDKQNKD